jgi:hypothetical protein
LQKAFGKNTRPWRSIFFTRPAGWGKRARHPLAEVLAEADRYVQSLNDRFTNPSGDSASPTPAPLTAGPDPVSGSGVGENT